MLTSLQKLLPLKMTFDNDREAKPIDFILQKAAPNQFVK